jgi:hypothetical protein
MPSLHLEETFAGFHSGPWYPIDAVFLGFSRRLRRTQIILACISGSQATEAKETYSQPYTYLKDI